MITPPPLYKGDTIGLVAPSGKLEPYYIDRAEELLKDKGFEVIKGKHVYNTWYKFAGTDQERSTDLQAMLDHPSVKVIWCVRGGYGLLRIWNRLNFKTFQTYPKWIIGYSDITILHSMVNQFAQTVSIHGEMPLHFFKPSGSINSSALNSVFQMLSGDFPDYECSAHPLNIKGKAEGELIGGNLSVLYSMRGTPLEPNTENKILFIEETSEYLYHIDRMMMNLYHGGWLQSLKGVIVGGMSDMQESSNEFGYSAYEIIHHTVKPYGIPVGFAFPAGHQIKNLALLMGKKVRLTIDQEKLQLSFL